MKKKLILMIMCIVLCLGILPLSVFAAEEAFDYQENTEGNTIRISKYLGSDQIVTIPAEIDGKRVTVIGEGAFSGCSNISQIIIPEGIKHINKEAFAGCSSLSKMELPDSLASIGDYAFRECKKIKSIEIPASVQTIGIGIFYGDSGLSKISVDENNKKYHSQNNCNGIIKKSGKYLIAGCKNTKIPEGVKYIDKEAFAGCSNLKSICLPESLISIKEYAFKGCKYLKSIKIPANVQAIGQGIFYGATRLSEISVDKNNKRFDSRKDCNGIIKTNSMHLVAGCKKTEIPEGIKYIDKEAFGGNTRKKINIPVSVRYIKDGAFKDSSLKSIYYEGSIAEWNKVKKGDLSKDVIIHFGKLAKTKISLQEKTVTYNKKSQKIGNATVKGSSRKIIYTYFTNKACTKKTKKNSGAKKTGGAPKYAGKYYVKAHVAKDRNYEAADSKATSFKIKKVSQKVKLKKKNFRVAYGDKPFSLVKTNGDGKITYKSSNKKVLAGTNNGKLKIVGSGKASIQARAQATKNSRKSKEKKINVTVYPYTYKRIHTKDDEELVLTITDPSFVNYRMMVTVNGVVRENPKSKVENPNRLIKDQKVEINNLKKGDSVVIEIKKTGDKDFLIETIEY